MILTKNTLTKKFGTNRHKNHNKFFDSERRRPYTKTQSAFYAHCMRVGHTKCTHEDTSYMRVNHNILHVHVRKPHMYGLKHWYFSKNSLWKRKTEDVGHSILTNRARARIACM